MDHIFLSCPFARSVSALFPRSAQPPPGVTSVGVWFWQVATPFTRKLGVVVFWYLWKTKYNYSFQFHPINPFHVYYKATYSLLEWNMSRLYTGPGSTQAASTDWWLHPPLGWHTLNFDGSFHSSTGRAGMGGLARDPFGKLLMAYTAEVRTTHPRR